MRALVLGNGESRLNKLVPSNCDEVWACNLAFQHNVHANYIVATDAHRQHEIWVSGYAQKKECVFLDWTPIPANRELPDTLRDGGFKVIANEYREGMMVMSGWQNTMYVTFLGEQQGLITNVKMRELPRRFSSGGLAMWLAAKTGNDEILLAGFGDKKHVYREYIRGPDEPHIDHWQKERDFIINNFKEIEWRYI
jgi:hypothetical protein